MRLLVPVRLALDAHNLSVMNQAVHECDHAGRVGEHLTPLGKRFVRGDQRALVLVAPADQLKQQIGILAGIRQIPDLINDQQRGPGVVAQSGAQCLLAVQTGQFAQQLAGGGEHDGMPLQHRLMCNILGNGGSAHA